MRDAAATALVAIGTLLVADAVYFGFLEQYRAGKWAPFWWLALLGSFGLAGALFLARGTGST
jgi:hypothetical protein